MKTFAHQAGVAALMVGMSVGAPAGAAEIDVRIIGGAPNSGQILVALYAAEAAWLKAPAAGMALPLDGTGAAVAQFTGHAPGDYALAVIYDENMDGELDRNGLGVPTERYGFSNGARARFGPPDWSDATFTVSEDGAQLTINLQGYE